MLLDWPLKRAPSIILILCILADHPDIFFWDFAFLPNAVCVQPAFIQDLACDLGLLVHDDIGLNHMGASCLHVVTTGAGHKIAFFVLGSPP